MPIPLEYDPDDATLPGMSLREYCEASGMTYSAFARKVPCSVSYPRMVAKGLAWPSYSMACRFESITDGMVSRERWYPPQSTARYDITEPTGIE